MDTPTKKHQLAEALTPDDPKVRQLARESASKGPWKELTCLLCEDNSYAISLPEHDSVRSWVP